MPLKYSRFKANWGLATMVTTSTFSKITFNKGIMSVKFAKPKITANTASIKYLGTNRLNGFAKESSLK